MTQKQAIQLFEDRKVRTVWDERTETWYFSVLDVISALTDTVNPTDYFKKMRKRDEALASFVGTNCPQIAMRSETGVMRKTLAGDVKTVLRIIQSIPSQKAEPFKQWMAQVASDRLDQMQDPELSIEQAVADYKRLGYSNNVLDFFKQNICIVFFHTLPSYFTLFFLFLLSQIIVRIAFRLFRLRVRCEQT